MLKRIHAPTLAVHVAMRSREFAGKVVEATGDNDGEMIDKIEEVWGLKGEPYCAMGQYYVFAKTLAMDCGVDLTPKTIVKTLAGMKSYIKTNYLTFHPAVAEMVKAATSRHQYKMFARDTDAHGLLPGDYLCFNWAKKGAAPQRHIAMVVSRWNGSYIETVEWNTAPDNASALETNDPKRGGGCFIRHRSPDPAHITGWIRWQ